MTITINDDTEFRDDVTFYGVLTSTEVGVVVGPDTRVVIVDNERELDCSVAISKEDLSSLERETCGSHTTQTSFDSMDQN